MPKIGRKSKVVLIAILAVALVFIGWRFFPVPKPELHLSPNYGSESTADEAHTGSTTNGEISVEYSAVAQVRAGDTHGEGSLAEHTAAAESGEEGTHVPPPFFKIGPIWFSNTMIASCLSVLVLGLLFFFGTRRMRLVPTGLQNVCETIVEALLNFFIAVAGEGNARRFLAILATIFLFVITNAWMGLLPVFNVFGWGYEGESSNLMHEILPSVFPPYEGWIVTTTVLRPANTDINVPLALALVSFVAVEYWGISSVGLRRYSSKFFRFGQFFSGLGQLFRGRLKSAFGTIFYGGIDIFVGILELLSEFVRIISFTVRLFGNMTAGEVLLLMIAFLVPFLIPLPFYGLETLLGAIQALIFAGLTLVFATLAITPHEHEEEHTND